MAYSRVFVKRSDTPVRHWWTSREGSPKSCIEKITLYPCLIVWLMYGCAISWRRSNKAQYVSEYDISEYRNVATGRIGGNELKSL